MKTDYQKLEGKLKKIADNSISYDDYANQIAVLEVKGWREIGLLEAFSEMMYFHFSETEIIGG